MHCDLCFTMYEKGRPAGMPCNCGASHTHIVSGSPASTAKRSNKLFTLGSTEPMHHTQLHHNKDFRCDLSELLRTLERLKEEGFMVQLTVEVNITGGSQPLQFSPSDVAADLPAGADASGEEVSQLSGGVPPYEFSLDAASDPLPDGLDIQGDPNSGLVTWEGTPTTSGQTANIILDATDSTGATTQLRRSVVSRPAVSRSKAKTRR